MHARYSVLQSFFFKSHQELTRYLINFLTQNHIFSGWIIIIIQKICSAHIQKHRGKLLLFHDKCPGFFYVHYTTHGTHSFTSYPKDEAITVKCLAQGHKRRDRPGLDLNPHSDNTRTWVQCTRSLGHDTPMNECRILSVYIISLFLMDFLSWGYFISREMSLGSPNFLKIRKFQVSAYVINVI